MPRPLDGVTARSFLFVPASRPERFAKALDSGADCVVVDLEDAVPAEHKSVARDQLADQLAAFDPAQLARILVRINAAGTSWHAQDVNLVAKWVSKGLAGAMVPKAESPTDLRTIGVAAGPAARLVPLVESLAGLDAIDLLARTPQVVRLAFGHLDFQIDLGIQCQPDELELLPARMAIVAASRRARLAAPVDGITIYARNEEAVAGDAARARAIGFGAKLCIHPSQVRAVNEAFTPKAEEVEWAARVVAAAKEANGGAFTIDGRMVDLPVIRLAQRTLDSANAS